MTAPDRLPYATSSDAYRAIHKAIAHWIMGWLEESGAGRAEDFRKLMELAALMREIEEHTDVE